jgi:hypothetical protein
MRATGFARRRRSPNAGQVETSGVAEQSFTRNDDSREIFGVAVPKGNANRPPWLNKGTQSNTPFSVDTLSIRILPANPRRRYLIIQNKSADVMYINFGQLADIYNGIQISAGGAYELIGGGPGGSFVPSDDVSEGMEQV